MMNSETINKMYEKHKKLVDSYFEDDSKKLNEMIDKILFRLNFKVENSDFYSLGSEIFLDTLCRYDETQDFNGFLYSCLIKKFKTEMTRQNRQKRKIVLEVEEEQEDGSVKVVRKSIPEVSLDAPVYEGSTRTIGDMIAETKVATDYDIDKTFFEDDGEKYTEKMLKYISRLSNLQREVVKLIISGYKTEEIQKILHISTKQCQDCMVGIRSYRNAKVLL